MGAAAFLARKRCAGDQTGEREGIVEQLLESVLSTPDPGEPPESRARFRRRDDGWPGFWRRDV
jgi:hypothetical protein